MRINKAWVLVLPILMTACGRDATPRDKFIALTNEQCMTYYKSAHTQDYTVYCKCLSESLAAEFSDGEVEQFLAGTLDLEAKQISDEFALRCASKMPGAM